MAKKKRSSQKGPKEKISGKSGLRPKFTQPGQGKKASAKKLAPTFSRIPIISKVIQIGIILVVVGCPLLFFIWSKDNFLLPKEMYAESVLIVLLAIYLIKVVQDGKFNLVKSDLWYPLAAFTGITLFSMLNSVSLYLSLLDLAEFLSYFFILFLTLNFIRTHTQRNRIFWALVAVCIISSSYAVFQFYDVEFKFWARIGGRRNIFSTFGNPNYYSGFVAAVIPAMVGYFLALRGARKYILGFAIPLTYIGMMMTFTRGAILGLVVSLFVMLILLIRFFKLGFFTNYFKRFIYLAVVFVVITTIFSTENPINVSRQSLRERAISTAAPEDIAGRQRPMIWEVSLPMAKDHPIIGQGVGTYKYHYRFYQGEFFENPANQEKLPMAAFAREAHNEYLQILIEMGSVEVIFWLWLLFSFFRGRYRSLKRQENRNHFLTHLGLTMGVLVLLVHATVSFPLHIVPNGILLYLLMGLAASKGEGSPEPQPAQNGKKGL